VNAINFCFRRDAPGEPQKTLEEIVAAESREQQEKFTGRELLTCIEFNNWTTREEIVQAAAKDGSYNELIYLQQHR
jgi:hypothetical protein